MTPDKRWRPGATLAALRRAIMPRRRASSGEGSIGLRDMPAMALDCETTGLDPSNDRIVSIAAVPLAGGAATLDLLIDPGMPISPASTAIHRITDDMVAGAPRFAEAAGQIAAALAGHIVVGHDVAFDAAMLRAEALRAEIVWDEPAMLCTRRLARALYPRLPDVDLETVARRLGVSVQERHTARGDALTAAAIFVRMLPRLERRGIATLAGAHRLAQQGRA